MEENCLSIAIDRTVPLSSLSWVGEEWSVKKHSKRALRHLFINLHEAHSVQLVEKKEGVVCGREYLRRIAVIRRVPVDIGALLSLALKESSEDGPYYQEEMIPESWRKPTDGGLRKIFFGGTLLRHTSGIYGLLYLCYSPFYSRWRWRCGCRWLPLGFSFEDEALFF